MLLLIVGCAGAVILLQLAYYCQPSQRFARRDGSFHRDFALACAAIYDEYAAQLTNAVAVVVNPESVVVPEVIRSVNPRLIRVYPRGTWVFAGMGKITGYGIQWERDGVASHIWHLRIYSDGGDRTLYSLECQSNTTMAREPEGAR